MKTRPKNHLLARFFAWLRPAHATSPIGSVRPPLSPAAAPQLAACLSAIDDIDEVIAMFEITLRGQQDDEWPPFEATAGGKLMKDSLSEMRLARSGCADAIAQLLAGAVFDPAHAVGLVATSRDYVRTAGHLAAAAVQHRRK